VMDYIDLELYNDLWRNSHFEQASKDNTILTEGLSIQLNTPKEGGGSCWAATNEASSTVVIDSFTTQPGAGISIRNILSDANIEQRGDLVRVKFLNPSSTVSFQINEAYILKRLSGDDGSGSSMQLWFSDNPLIIGEEEPGTYGLKIGDDLGNASPSRALVAGDPGKYAWSNWAVFPIEADTSDYFITLHVDNGIPLATQINVTGWEGQELNSYWVEGNVALMEGWASSTESNNIYCAESGENWPQYGTARSGTYDTEIDDPQYDEINWQPTASPSGSNIDVSARSSDSADMSGATSWKTVTTSGGSLTGIDGGRYVEFEATLEKTSGYDDYTNYPWIDDVTINWPGESILCRIGGYFIRKPDYGIIKLTIDDRDLTKGLEFSIALSKDILPGETYETSLVADVEPRNTGR